MKCCIYELAFSLIKTRKNKHIMEELSKIAMAHYQASTNYLQTLAHDFFKAMDRDGDGRINQTEFLEFMKEEGHSRMTNMSIFKLLDLDGNGTLDFPEVMTAYYIIKSGRPFCDYCKKFITSTFLTCVGCLEDPNGQSFYLCLDCYVAQRCDHSHDDLSRFVDNYSLLEAMTKLKLNETRSRPSESVGTSSGYNLPHPVHNHHTVNNYTTIHNNNYRIYNPPPQHVQQPTTSGAVIPQRQGWITALDVLNVALYSSAIAGGFCTIL